MTNTDFIPFGFLPINKPVGPTSHDMVGKLRRLLPRKVKAGHTGTLDPFASGVMILAVGKATRFADDVHLLSKSYRAEIRLGQSTNTLDLTGEVDEEMAVPPVEQSMLDAIAQRMTGPQDQIPPAFSAKRVAGKKSYELARENKAVELKASRIVIHELALSLLDAHTVLCDVTCSTGTYIRSLGRDIGEALGTCAHLVSLERTSVGPLKVSDCLQMEHLDRDNIGAHLYPVSRLLPSFPEIVLPDQAFPFLVQGRAFPTQESLPSAFLAVCREEDQIKGIFRCIFDENSASILPKQMCYLRPNSQ